MRLSLTSFSHKVWASIIDKVFMMKKRIVITCAFAILIASITILGIAHRSSNIEGDWVAAQRSMDDDPLQFYRFAGGRVLLVGQVKTGILVQETGRYAPLSNGLWSVSEYRRDSNLVYTVKASWTKLAEVHHRGVARPMLKRSRSTHGHNKLIASAIGWTTNNWKRGAQQPLSPR